MKTKWHYFKREDELCHYETEIFKPKPKIILITACNRNIEEVTRYSEFKSRVDCKTCLRILNRNLYCEAENV